MDACCIPTRWCTAPQKFGPGNVFHPFCVIGGDPQDYTFRGEHVELNVGEGNIFREHVTVSRGTKKGGGITRIGSKNFFLAYSHIGHDCQVGDNTLFVNGATLAGHVTVQDFVTIGAFSPVHQFCRLGRYAYIGACTVITQDVLPFSLIVTERETKCFGRTPSVWSARVFPPSASRRFKKPFACWCVRRGTPRKPWKKCVHPWRTPPTSLS